jgi:iron complex outermembrane recepter protein
MILNRDILRSTSATACLAAALCSWLGATSVFAQAAPPAPSEGMPPASGADAAAPAPAKPASADAGPASDIVVTGTLIRGIAPVGTNVVGLNKDAIIRSGATTTNQILTNIPQISSNFNSTPRATSDFSGTIAPPNIRNLPGVPGSNGTLLLLNGRRFALQGINYTMADPTTIPAGAIERVEVVPDGGSATYGSDAIGGVINFITRKRFNGVEVSGNWGFGQQYQQQLGDVTVGRDWGSGSAFISYEYSHNDAIFGRDRGYETQNLTSRGGGDYRTTSCAAGNVLAGGTSYALPSLAPGTNLCDTTDNDAMFPRETRHDVYASLTQQLNDHLTFDVSAYYAHRVDIFARAQERSSATITSDNPFFRSIAGETSQVVQFAYDPVFGRSRYTTNRADAWGVAPTFEYNVDNNWKLRVEGNYGRSFTKVREQTYNTEAEAAALTATTPDAALDPYDLGQTNPAVLATIHNFENYARGTQDFADGRAVLSGHLLQLPGGPVNLAAGTEYFWQDISAQNTGAVIGEGGSSRVYRGSRDFKSVFGEVVVPIFGDGNAIPGIRKLQLSGAVRYDRYSDFGGTTNPKLGVTYKPIDSLTIRGNFGTSFVAPSLSDTVAASDTRAQIFPNSGNLGPGSSPSDAQRRTILIAGGNPDLKPQKAKTFAIGADYKPEFIQGLTVSATFYHYSYKNIISTSPWNTSTIFDPAFASFIAVNPTIDQARQLLGPYRLDGISSIDALYAGGQSPYAIIDARRVNLGRFKLDGIDFNVAYQRKTSFGSINASFAGTTTLKRKNQPFPSAAYVDELMDGTSPYSFVGILGATVGQLSGQIQWNRTAGFRVEDVVNQTYVKSFNVLNAYLGYDLDGPGALKGTSVSLNLLNMFNTRPPYYNGSGGYTNGSTLGRIVQIGFRKKF